MRRMLLLCLISLSLLLPDDLMAGCVTLQWTATGDDGWSGRASRYDIRYSRQFITAQNFYFARQYPYFAQPAPSGERESVTICGLEPFAAYYFAIKIADEQGNWSDISNVVLTAADDSSTGRGDVNLNTIPYEAGDAVTFTNYFIQGPAAFLYDVNKQIAATDVNGDNLNLSVADLTYLVRIMVGDALPISKLSPYTRQLTVETQRNPQTVAVHSVADATIGAAYFVWRVPEDMKIGEPVAGEALNGMALKHSFDGDLLKVLIYDFETDRIPPGRHNLLRIAAQGLGELELLTVDAADYDGEAYAIAGQMLTLPTEFDLKQNYPNPFNPSTSISFTMLAARHVTVTIYNAVGQTVKVLLDEPRPAGEHSVQWDGSSESGYRAASGVYFYRIQAGDFSQTRKMMLLK